MSDRVHSLTVVLDKDYRSEDDCEKIVQAIFQLKGVIRVTKHVSDINSHMAMTRAKNELGQALIALTKFGEV